MNRLSEKNCIRLISGIVLFFIATNVSFAGKWKLLKPASGDFEKEIILVNKKEWVYYSINPGESVSYDFSDYDCNVRLLTRADLGRKSKGEKVYTFRVGFNGEDGRLYSRATRKYKNVKLLGSKNIIGIKKTIELGKLKNVSEITISVDKKAKYPVFFRLQVEREEYAETIPYTSINPHEYEHYYDINTNDKISRYYEVDDSQQLILNVIGPTVIKINARMLMEKLSSNKAEGSVKVFENSKIKNIYPLEFKKSIVSTVINIKEKVPSRADKIFIEVPRGRHVYTFESLATDCPIIFRFFIPEKDLTNNNS